MNACRRWTRWMGHLAGVLLLAGVALFWWQLTAREDLAVGYVSRVAVVANDMQVAEVRAFSVKYVVCERSLTEGAWLFAHGDCELAGQQRVLRATELRLIRPSAAWTANATVIHAIAKYWLYLAAAAGLACFLLRFSVERAAAALLSSVIAGVSAWHAVVFAAFDGAADAKQGAPELIGVIGAAVGLLLGARRDGCLAWVMQRVAVAAVAWCVAPLWADCFGWATLVAQLSLVVLAVVSPFATLVVLSSWALSVVAGLNALSAKYLALAVIIALASAMCVGGGMSARPPRYSPNQAGRWQERGASCETQPHG